MAIKEQLEQILTAFKNLSSKVKTKLAQNQQTLTETTQKLNETNHKLELQAKENSENEKVLEQLLKEFQELEKEL
jgi:ABC-type transporter Mla subunit MlaD